MSEKAQSADLIPRAFIEGLRTHIKNNYGPKSFVGKPWTEFDTSYFAKGIVRLNDSFTLSRSEKSLNYFNDPIMRSGYLAYYLPVNAAKAASIFLKHLTAKDLPGDSQTLRIVDFGSGPLTQTLGFLFALEQMLARGNCPLPKTVTVCAVEQNRRIIDEGRTLIKNYLAASPLGTKIQLIIKPITADLLRLRSGEPSDLLLFGNVLNEIPLRNEQNDLVFRLLNHWSAPNSLILFLEPAAKKISRDLQNLRDALLEKTDLKLLGPCLHHMTCPLNQVAKGDWCHFYQSWQAPLFIREFDRVTKLKKSVLMYSYLMFKRGSEAAKYRSNQFVAISDLLISKGRQEIIGCGPAGRIRFVRSNRDRSEDNHGFDLINRGTNFSATNIELPKNPELEYRSIVDRDTKFLLKAKS